MRDEIEVQALEADFEDMDPDDVVKNMCVSVCGSGGDDDDTILSFRCADADNDCTPVTRDRSYSLSLQAVDVSQFFQEKEHTVRWLARDV
jgi:hypothetical protein